ncbi:ROK family protein [Mesorhizobium sp. RP14(2022)]|uniref:ROK family protein n=1 Tax=Mesorhizobium liriopis TaxID=2953882 RepID=A0ABT1C340_9HYPH|nr:ROK family protein [Mesorhizobium liriopis]MCO6049192.1 ROK family protein [Mesorhizobium liriopis]
MSEPLAIGVDIGGTRLRAALVDRTGRLHARQEVRTAAKDGPEAVVSQIRELVAIVSAHAPRGQVAGIGVCSPGPIDTEEGIALGVPTLAGWDGAPIARMIGDALNLPVRLENDGIAAAHGEWRFGAGRGLRHLVYVTVSTGIGGGVVLDGRLLHGRQGLAGHIGHMGIERDGALCSCGTRGCWEAYASGTAFARNIRQRVAMESRSALAADAGPAEVFAEARAGDHLAAALVAEEGDVLGLGIASLVHLFSPEAVILGGGVSNGFDLLEPFIRQRLQTNAMPAFRDTILCRAGLGEDSGLVGAAALHFTEEAATEQDWRRRP